MSTDIIEEHGMKFCNRCGNLLYLKKINTTGEIDDVKSAEDGGGGGGGDKEINTNSNDHSLGYFCKKCGDRTGIQQKSILVYSIDYSNDVSHKYIDNDLLLYDPTIPHSRKIKCINPHCISNLTCQYGFTFLHKLDDSKDEEAYSQSLTTDFTTKLERVRPFGLKVSYMSHSKFLILFSTIPEEMSDAEQLEYMQIVYQYVNNEASFVNVTPVKKYENDVLFIKCDKKNMIFLYKCSNCLTNWKNK